MNQRQLASALFAVIGVFIAATRFPDLVLQGSTLVRWDPALEDPTSPFSLLAISIFGFVGLLTAVLIGILLVVLRERIAGLLFSAPSGPVNAPEVQAVALSVLGCYFVVQGIHGMLRVGAFHWPEAAQAVLGLGLFLGGRGIASVWSRLRTGGVRTTSYE